MAGLFAVLLDIADEAGLAEEETKLPGTFQFVPKCLVGMDGEVGGDERQLRAGGNILPEKITSPAPVVIVPQP